LRTHSRYAAALRGRPSSKPATVVNYVPTQSDSTSSSREASTQPSDGVASDPRLPLASFPSLPFEEPFPHEFREIFDNYVTHLFDLGCLVLLTSVRTDSKESEIQSCLSSEMRMTLALAHCKTHMGLQSSGRCGDAVSDAIYGKLLQILRQKLDNLQDADIDDLIFCVIALADFDVLTGKPRTLTTHRTAIQHLVSARGGVHNLGRSLCLIMHADRRLAVMTGEYPLFSSPASRSGKLTQRPSSTYGSGFASTHIARNLDQEIILFCQDECQLIELFEQSKISFDMDHPSLGDLNRLPLFHYSRDQLSAEFANLHAQHCPRKGKSWCVLLATKLVEHPIVMGGLMSMLTEYLAQELTDWLKKDLHAGHSAEWLGFEDMPTWILWVLVTLQVTWEGKIWAQDVLRERLLRMYTSSGKKEKSKQASVVNGKVKRMVLHSEWRRKEWEKNQRWMWSGAHLKTRFDEFCARLESVL
jgi:hypothetical protein